MQHVKKKQLCWSVHKSVNPAENLALKSPEIHVFFFFYLHAAHHEDLSM